MTIVGAGKYTYRLVQDWARAPEGQALGPVSAVATDPQDRVYASQLQDPLVMVFDREGNYLSSWGLGVVVDPHGLYIAGDAVFIADRGDSVCLKFTLDGRPLQIMGNRGVHSDTGTEEYGGLVVRAAGPFNHPTEVVPAPSGDLYVSDGERNCRVHRFSPEGRLIASWGEPGKAGPGQFHMPHGILVGQDGRVYVCDRENSRIQVFSPEGDYLAMWTDIQPPTDIHVDADGIFYVSQLAFNAVDRYPGWPSPVGIGSAITDSAGRRTIRPGAPPKVSVLDREGKVLASWESRSAHGMCVDSRGDIYVGLQDARSVDKYVRQP